MTSLITTLLNEKKNIGPWLESILRQSVCPDEIVIVDGGSTDGTWQWLQEQAADNPKLKIYQFKGNISSGRNYAIKMATGENVVVPDAGCYYDNDWFKTMSEPFGDGYELICGAFGPWLQKSDGFVKLMIFACTTPAAAEFANDWLPSSRSVAFTKSLWQRAGDYPEWLPICEDIVYDLKMLKLQPKVFYSRKPLAFWEARPNLKKYFIQLYKYTRGDGHGKLWLNRQLTRYGVYLGSLLLIILAARGEYWLILFFLAGLVIYMKKFWIRWLEFTKDRPALFRLVGIICLPFVIAYGDVAKMCGWPVGVYERRTGKIKFQAY